MSKRGKICAVFIVCIVIVGVALAIVFRDNIKDTINRIQESRISVEEKKEEQLKNDDFFKSLEEAQQQEIEKKFNQIVDSEEYKDLEKAQQEEILEKFIESEKLQDEIKKEKETQKKSEDIVIPEDATEEEKQALQQEKDSLLIQETIKNAVASDQLSISYQNSYIRKINSIYLKGGYLFVNVDIVQEETIAGVTIVSQYNNFISISSNDGPIKENFSLSEILENLKADTLVFNSGNCSNFNTQSQIDFFNNNKNQMDDGYLTYLENKGYSFEVVESWDNKNGEPEFIIRGTNGKDERMLYVSKGSDGYYASGIQKVCPEFWAELEKQQ